MQHVVITGANRGLGLAFATLYLERGAQVFAGARRPEAATRLEELKSQHGDQLIIVPLDVSDEESIRRSSKIVASHTDSVDVLVNNAGIGGVSKATGQQERLGTFAFDDAWLTLRTMGVGPLLMAQEYLELLKAPGHAAVANITSGYGSVSANNGFPYYYSAAKATMHQLMRSFAADARPLGIKVLLFDPGWIRTDMGGKDAPTLPEESAAGMIRIIDTWPLEDSGAFLNWQGKTMAW